MPYSLTRLRERVDALEAELTTLKAHLRLELPPAAKRQQQHRPNHKAELQALQHAPVGEYARRLAHTLCGDNRSGTFSLQFYRPGTQRHALAESLKQAPQAAFLSILDDLYRREGDKTRRRFLRMCVLDARRDLGAVYATFHATLKEHQL